MFRIVELIGLLAPVAGVVLLVVYRGRTGGGLVWGLAGTATAAAGSLVGVVGERTLFLGSGEGGAEARLETVAWIRLGLLALAVVLLVVAVTRGRGPASTTPRGLLGLGVAAAVIGAALAFVRPDLAGHPGLSVLIGMLIEAVQFGLIGIGVLVLALAVVTGRPRSGADRRQDPSALAGRVARQAWDVYRQSRTPTGSRR